MRKEDAFEKALQAGTGALGGDDEELLQALDLARQLRGLDDSLPVRPGAGERARRRLQDALAQERRASAHRGRGIVLRLPIDGWLLRGAAACALAAVAVVAFLFAGSTSLLQPNGGVEAATFQGVLVENAGGVLSLETDDGLQTVSLPAAATITDAAGAAIAPSALTTGQVVEVKVKRPKAGNPVASAVRWQSLTSLRDWCAGHPAQCQRLRPRLEGMVRQCKQDAAACARLNSSLQELTSFEDQVVPRALDLGRRCQQGDASACQDLRRACRAQPAACAAIRDRLNVPID